MKHYILLIPWVILLIGSIYLAFIVNDNDETIIKSNNSSINIEPGQKWIRYDTSNAFKDPVTDTLIILDIKRNYCKLIWITTDFTDTTSMHIGLVTCCGRYLKK